MTSDPIELDVRSRDPVTLDVPGSATVEWGATEYMPVVGTDALRAIGYQTHTGQGINATFIERVGIDG